MKVNHDKHLAQESGYGCGVYAVANAIQDYSFAKSERIEQSKEGNTLGQLNKWLISDGHNMFIEPIYFNLTGKRLPKSICKIIPSGEGVSSMPVLIDIQFSEQGKMHFVAGEITTNGDLLVIDSLIKDVIEFTTLSKYSTRHFRCFGLYCFRDVDNGNYLMRYES